MRVSLNIIKQFIDFELPSVDELVVKINAQLGGVEEVIDLNAKYKDATIVKVVECEKHPNADKLSSCKIDAGTGELIQVVCGAPNVHGDMWAVWLPPESIVPSTYGTADAFKLGARELRGIVSNGMLASARELGISDNHNGIVEIKADDVLDSGQLRTGASFAEVFGLNDIIIDIENKMFTHRPDLFGQLGVAREIAGIFHHTFKSPDWYVSVGTTDLAPDTLDLAVFNEAVEKVPRFMAVVIKDVQIHPSPLWLQCALVAMGGKPINNIVDVTNYIMLLTAQPTHAYDYDKIRGGRLGARMAQTGEKITLLNGKTYELTGDDIVIADNEGAIGLAGIMGGSNSEVSDETNNIVLEVANFDMYAVRKSSMRHGIFTDAVSRFNKGQSPLQNDHILNLLMMSIKDVSTSEQASRVYDIGNARNPDEVRVTDKFINERLGLKLQDPDIMALLKSVEIDVTSPDDHDTYLEIYPPFWRTDLELPEDIVEEVGRLYGYDRLPLELPLRSAKPTPVNAQRELASMLRQTLMRSGANEVLTYSFVHERILQAATQNKEDSYGLSNALSPDLQYYRLSLTPSLLDKVHGNSKAGYDEFALFEIGKSHSKGAGIDGDGLPVESEQLAFIYSSTSSKDNAPFYQAKVFLEFLAKELHIELVYGPLSSESTSPVVAPFEPKRTAIISDKNTGAYIGIIGEYKNIVSKNFKLPEYAAGFELDIKALLELSRQADVQYQALSRFPSVERDVSLKVASDATYQQVFDALEKALVDTGIHTVIRPIGIYQPKDAGTKNISFGLTFMPYDKTLKSDEVNGIIDSVIDQLKTAVDASLV